MLDRLRFALIKWLAGDSTVVINAEIRTGETLVVKGAGAVLTGNLFVAKGD